MTERVSECLCANKRVVIFVGTCVWIYVHVDARVSANVNVNAGVQNNGVF